MWLARNKDGLLYGHEKKPIKAIYGWYSPGWVAIFPLYSFPEVKWTDEEPRELVLKPIKEE